MILDSSTGLKKILCSPSLGPEEAFFFFFFLFLLMIFELEIAATFDEIWPVKL